MKRKIIQIILILTIGIACEKEVKTLEMSTEEQDVFDYVNVYRKSKGLTLLTYDPTIQQEALNHSKKMADGTIAFSHDGFSDRIARIKSAIGGSNAAENIAYGVDNSFDLMTMWRNSTEHNANLLGGFTHAGIGIHTSPTGVRYYTLILLKL
ncbi:MAG: hypothetical protein RIS47_1816 [Bacteroidota bacterium]|jgi:uncharacterized protein YkwD